MKLDIKIRWTMDIDGHNEGDVQTLTLDCDYIDNKGDLLQSIEDEIGGYDEDIHYEILNEEQFWKDIDCPASEITNPAALVKDDHGITKERVKKALQVLIDNGIEADEAQTVLQALGYALLDKELEEFFE